MRDLTTYTLFYLFFSSFPTIFIPFKPPFEKKKKKTLFCTTAIYLVYCIVNENYQRSITRVLWTLIVLQV